MYSLTSCLWITASCWDFDDYPNALVFPCFASRTSALHPLRCSSSPKICQIIIHLHIHFAICYCSVGMLDDGQHFLGSAMAFYGYYSLLIRCLAALSRLSSLMIGTDLDYKPFQQRQSCLQWALFVMFALASSCPFFARSLVLCELKFAHFLLSLWQTPSHNFLESSTELPLSYLYPTPSSSRYWLSKSKNHFHYRFFEQGLDPQHWYYLVRFPSWFQMCV